ncbi:MAG TPA: SRPBCC family protein [Rhizomicrobium sp.]|nr:SRPBCC family protein [Rhizomicrobium sp.]
MKTVTIAPVRKTLTVKAAPARAFEVFTSGMSRWWPPTHSILKSPFKEAVIEPRAGGRWYHVGEDGSTCETGLVRVWDPPGRLVLVWQLGPDWEYDKDLDTEVELKFIPEGDGTRVEFEHRHIERMGEGAEKARAAVDAPGGWTAILEEFRKSVEGA